MLDEPNSNLDGAGDEALAAAIAGLRRAGSIVVVMAHRPSALQAVNRLLILQSGRVARFGSKEEIVQPVAAPVSSAHVSMTAPIAVTPLSVAAPQDQPNLASTATSQTAQRVVR